MKLSDIRDLSKEDILSALGLASKPSAPQRILGTLGIFAAGLLVGAGAALLLAPKSGEDLRDDLGQRFRKMREDREGDSDDESIGGVASSMRDEART
jgi:hypothetical protein